MKIVYIASEYSRVPDRLKILAVKRQMRAGDILLKRGIGFEAPLMMHFFDRTFPHDYETLLELDLEKISRCDALLRLPDRFGPSAGADRETARARELGKPVFTSFRECVKWAERQITEKKTVIFWKYVPLWGFLLKAGQPPKLLDNDLHDADARMTLPEFERWFGPVPSGNHGFFSIAAPLAPAVDKMRALPEITDSFGRDIAPGDEIRIDTIGLTGIFIVRKDKKGLFIRLPKGSKIYLASFHPFALEILQCRN